MRKFWLIALLLVFAAGEAGAALPVSDLLKAFVARRMGDYSGAAEHLRAAIKADPDSVELKLRLVRILMVFGEADQGLAVLDEGLKRNPGHPELLIEKAKFLIIAGRNKEAAAIAEDAVNAGGGDRAYALAVRLFNGLGEDSKTLALAERWLASGTTQKAEAHFERAVVYFKLGDAENSIAEFKKVLELKPDHQPSLDALAGLVMRGGDKAEALKLYRDLININPHQVKARLSLAQILIEAGRDEEGAKALLDAEQWVGNDTDSRLKMAMLYLQSGKPEKAQSVLEPVPEQARDDRYWFFMGLGLFERAEYGKAVAAFDRVDIAGPLGEDAAIKKAMALSSSGRREEAYKAVKELKEKAPDTADFALSIASLLMGLEKHAEAAEVLKNYMEKHPETKEAGLHFTLGVAYDKMGEWEKCVEEMRRVLEIDPTDGHALNFIGYTYAEKGINLDEAEKLVLRAVELLPKNGFVIDSLGWVYYKQGRYAEAVSELKRATELSPQDAIIMEHLGDAYLKMGDKDGAKAAYEKSLSLAPASKSVPEKLESLK